MVSEGSFSDRGHPGTDMSTRRRQIAASPRAVNDLVERLRDAIRRRWRRLRTAVLSRLGYYRRWREVDWPRVERLVFVCTGNICRSPYAEALVRQRGRAAISCGTRVRPGAAADPVARRVAREFGVDLSAHASAALESVPIGPADLLIAMDVVHLRRALELAEGGGAQLTLLGLWDGEQPMVISDPFGLEEAEFRACFRRIDRCLAALLTNWPASDHETGRLRNM